MTRRAWLAGSLFVAAVTVGTHAQSRPQELVDKDLADIIKFVFAQKGLEGAIPFPEAKQPKPSGSTATTPNVPVVKSFPRRPLPEPPPSVTKPPIGAFVQAAGGAVAMVAQVVQVHNWIQQFEPLTDNDKATDAGFPGLPRVPTDCPLASDDQDVRTGSLPAGCSQCFADAYTQLLKARSALHRNKRIADGFMNWAKTGIATGDSIAGAMGLGGLIWVRDRQEIQKTLDNVKQAYASGYARNLDSLQKALMKIAECEEKLYKNHDWYSRYGFVYYDAVATMFRATF
jgi:hypothetical protein